MDVKKKLHSQIVLSVYYKHKEEIQISRAGNVMTRQKLEPGNSRKLKGKGKRGWPREKYLGGSSGMEKEKP